MELMEEFPDKVATTPIGPVNKLKEQAYYAAMINGVDPVTDYRTAVADIELEGKSELVNTIKQQYEQEQDDSIKQTVSALIEDPSVSLGEKQNALYSYATRGYLTRDIREKYKEQVAVRDTATTEKDRRAQDVWVDVMQQEDKDAQQLQQEKDRIGASFDSSTVNVVAGILRDLVPGVAVGWNVSVAKSASQTGVDNSWYERAKSFLFSGHGNKAIAEHYKNLPTDKKIEFVKRLGESYKTNPSFDFNSWIDFMTQIEDPNGTALTLLEDVASVFNLVGLGFIAKEPRHILKALKYQKYGDVYKPKILPVGPNYSGKAHAPTGDLAKDIDSKSKKRAPETFEQSMEAESLRLAAPNVDPISPAGTTATASREAAQNLGAGIVADKTGELAQAAGTTRGAVISDWLLPKIDEELGKLFPDLRAKLDTLDKYMSGVYERTKFDPFLLPVTKMQEEREKIFRVLQETSSPVYHQASSTFEQTIQEIKGAAVFGRNATHGFDTIDEATDAAFSLEKAISVQEGGLTKNIGITEKGGQFFVKWDYSKPYNFIDQLVFGENPVSFKFKLPVGFGKEVGLNLDWLARSPLGFLISPVQKFDQWFIKGSQNLQYRQAVTEHDFIREIRNNIYNVSNKDALFDVLNHAQENQKYLSPREIREMFPNISTREYEELVRANEYYKRIVDYQYNWVNRYDKSVKASGGYGAIYNKTGDLEGYGTINYPSDVLREVKYVWDMQTGEAVLRPHELQGKTIVRLETPANDGNNNVYEFALVDKLDPLPAHTLPKIEGYVPRKNIENWYVKKTPRTLRVNGNEITGASKQGVQKLKEHQKVIGAGDTAAQAEQLAARFREEFPDFDIEVKKERGDTADAILTDYRVFKEVLDYGKKRGERLPTLNGFARLEDPLVALIDSIKTAVRMDAWKDYKEVFRTNFMKRFGGFVKTEDFPSVLTDMQAPKGATQAELKEFAMAQRLFEQFSKMQYHEVLGDRVWKDAMHLIGDVMERLPGSFHRAPKEAAEWGNVLAKLPKSIASYLLLYMSPQRQHLVQTQQLLELSVLDKATTTKVIPNIPAVFVGVLEKAQALGTKSLGAKAIHAFSSKINPLTKMDDFDETVEALYNSGVFHSVDLNMMLHGMISDVQRPLKESALRKGFEVSKAIIKAPGQVGKAVGYTPAELNNQIGLWLFEKEMWKKNNPGKNWNTPETIAKITSDAWERGHAMATTANSVWYQEGFISTFTQFMKISDMAFMQLFSSKGLSPNDRLKLAASRVLLFGVAGVPMKAAIDGAFDKYADEETLTEYKEWKQGVLNWAVNWTINKLLPEDSRTALNFADSMSPIPDSVPYYDLLVQVSKAFNGDPYDNPRFAAWAATTAFGESVRDMWRLYRADQLDTVDSFKVAAYEAAKAASGHNNFAKAMYMKRYNDLASKFGTNQGIEFTRAEIFFQVAGIQSQKLLDNYALGKMMKEKKAWINEEADAILSDMKRWRQAGYIQTPEDFINAINKRATFVDPEVAEEVRDLVFKKDRENFLSRSESEFMYMAQQKEGPTNSTLKKMRATIQAGDNEKLKQLLKELDSVRDEE